MAYFNNINNADLYSTSFVFGEPDAYPFLSQLSATEEVDVSQTYGSLADRWGMVGHPRPMVGSPTSLRATASCGKRHCSLFIDRCLTREPLESVASASWYAPQTIGYGQPSHPGYYRPAVGQQAQSHSSGPSSWDGSINSTAVLEPSMTVPTPSSSKSSFLFRTI